MNSGSEYPTCCGLSHRDPNKLEIPTLWPCEFPKSQDKLLTNDEKSDILLSIKIPRLTVELGIQQVWR